MGKDETEGERQKREGMKWGRGRECEECTQTQGTPEHITTVTRPLILTPAVSVAMDTSRLGPSLHTHPILWPFTEALDPSS